MPPPAPARDLPDLGRVALGTMTFGDQVDATDAARMVHEAREAGVVMFDTANGYTGGTSEEILGHIIAPFRDEIVLATKVGQPVGPGPDQRGLSAAAIERGIEDSLRRLGTDHVDIYYFHTPDVGTPVDESLEAADRLVRAGKVTHLAQSNYAAWQIADMHCRAARHGWAQPWISQPMYNLLARRIEDEYAGFSLTHGLVDVVYNPLAGGLLTGKHDPGAWQPGGRFEREQYRDRYWNDAQFTAVEALRAAAAEADLSLLELSLRWLLTRPLVDVVLLGASSPAQLSSNLAALDDRPLDEGTLAAVDRVWEDLRGRAPSYHRAGSGPTA